VRNDHTSSTIRKIRNRDVTDCSMNKFGRGGFVANGAKAMTVGAAQFWPLDHLLGMDLELLQNVETPNYELIMAACCMIIGESPSARAMMEEAADEGWSLGCDTLENGDFTLDLVNRIIIVDHNGMRPAALAHSEYFQNALMVCLVRALRDVWQEKRHGAFDEQYGPQDVLMLERVRAADREAMAILSAWELRSENHGEIWRHIIGSPEGDMAMAFSGHLERDPSSLFNGKALVSAFRQWFADQGRSNAVDHETLEYLDDILDSAPEANPFGDMRLTKGGVEILSCLPDRTAYLHHLGGEILSDPAYAGLHDPINQSHLFQIIHDMKVVVVADVPFQDIGLARKIFPEFHSSDSLH